MATLGWSERVEAIEAGNKAPLEAHLAAGGELAQIDLLRGVDAALKNDIGKEILALLVKHASPKVITEAWGVCVSEDDRVPRARAMIEAGVSIEHPASKNQTALQLATGNSCPKMVHFLLTAGADPHAPGEYGSALEIAQESASDTYRQMMEAALAGASSSPFDQVDPKDVVARLQRWAAALAAFARAHPDQTFYAVAWEADAEQLSANSEEAFRDTLAEYQKSFPDRYDQPDSIADLRASVGDFAFVIEEGAEGIDLGDTLDLSPLDPQPGDDRPFDQVLVDCASANVELLCGSLKRTPDFRFLLAHHEY